MTGGKTKRDGKLELALRNAEGSKPVNRTKTKYVKELFFFFFSDTATTEIYTLSLHDALPISVPVAVTSPTGEVEALNQPTLEYFGRTFEELKGWKSSDVVHPDDLERTVAAQLEAHKTGSAYNVESRHRRADGIYRWFNVLGLPLRDADGGILHWFHLQIDIDDRKRAEAQLAGEKRLLEMVASGHARTDVLTELCKFVETTAGDCKCRIYLIDWHSCTFRLGAGPSLPATFNDPVEGLTVTSD